MPRREGFLRDERGAAFAVVAVALPVLFGVAALAVDLGHALGTQAKLQATADAAALAAATSLDDEAQAKALAMEYASKNMAESLYGTVVEAADAVLGNWDTTTGTFTPGGAPTNAVRVIAGMTQANGNPVETYFARLVGIDTIDVTVDAIASTGSSGGFCILSLDPSQPGGVEMSGTVDLTLGNCGIAVTSTDPQQALKLSGTVNVQASSICVAGGAKLSGQVTVSPSEEIIAEGCDPPADPLADLAPPPEAGDSCDFTDFTLSASGASVSLSPGVYCGGIRVSGSDNSVAFAPGTYVLAGGGMDISGGNNALGGGDVLFYNTNSPGYDFEDVKLSGVATIDLTAPAGGDYAGVLFFQDPAATASASIKFAVSGTVDTNLDGTIYFPNHPIEYSGTSVQALRCTKMIGATVTYAGTSGATLPSTCASDAVSIGGSGSVRLVG